MGRHFPVRFPPAAPVPRVWTGRSARGTFISSGSGANAIKWAFLTLGSVLINISLLRSLEASPHLAAALVCAEGSGRAVQGEDSPTLWVLSGQRQGHRSGDVAVRAAAMQRDATDRRTPTKESYFCRGLGAGEGRCPG